MNAFVLCDILPPTTAPLCVPATSAFTEHFVFVDPWTRAVVTPAPPAGTISACSSAVGNVFVLEAAERERADRTAISQFHQRRRTIQFSVCKQRAAVGSCGRRLSVPPRCDLWVAI